ncbi:MAG TPA: phosphodiesterase [Nannocystis sp.]
MLVAQISDFHVAVPGSQIDRDHQTSAQLERAVAHLGRLRPRPDLVLCTGDLVQDGEGEEYRRLGELLAPLAMPYYLIPGNHDDREALRAAFAGGGYLPAQGLLHYVVDAGPLRLIALDTHVPGAPGGVLCEEQAAWLDAWLTEASERPAIVFMHHPPFRTGIAAMDAMGLADPGALAAVVQRHPQVERVLCGHLHRSIVTRFAGTIASTAPSTGPQLALDLGPNGRAVFGDEPPAFLLHAWDGQRLVTHLVHVAGEHAS